MPRVHDTDCGVHEPQRLWLPGPLLSEMLELTGV